MLSWEDLISQNVICHKNTHYKRIFFEIRKKYLKVYIKMNVWEWPEKLLEKKTKGNLILLDIKQ